MQNCRSSGSVEDVMRKATWDLLSGDAEGVDMSKEVRQNHGLGIPSLGHRGKRDSSGGSGFLCNPLCAAQAHGCGHRLFNGYLYLPLPRDPRTTAATLCPRDVQIPSLHCSAKPFLGLADIDRLWKQKANIPGETKHDSGQCFSTSVQPWNSVKMKSYLDA